MAKIKRNPFSFGSIVKEGDYCTRVNEEKVIEELLVSGEKVAIIGERRMGKTSLALHIIENILKKAYVHVDFMGISDEREAASRILNGIAGTKNNFFKFETVVKSLGHLRPALNMGDDGSPILVFNVRKNEVDESIDSAFKLLKEMSGKGVVIFFDEFQDLLKIEGSERIFGVLRAKIQDFSRIPFIFAGSHRSQMDKIFKDPNNPFYNGAQVLEITTIDRNDFYNFTVEKMDEKKITVIQDVFNSIYDMVYGISGDIQRFLRTAYLLMPKGSELNQEMAKIILEEMFKYEQTSFEELMEGSILTSLQRELLKQLGLDNTNPYAKDFMSRLSTTSSGLTRGLSSLLAKNLIYRYKKEYRFYNPFLKEWIKSEYR